MPNQPDFTEIEALARAITVTATPPDSTKFGNSMVALAWVVSAFIITVPLNIRRLLWEQFRRSVEEKIFDTSQPEEPSN